MRSSGLASMRRLPELAWLLEGADHVDVKTVIGSVDLRTFLANMFNYQPAWLTALFGFRAIFVRFLGIRQQGMRRRWQSHSFHSATIPMREGEPVAFFNVRMAREECYWIAEAKDTHLNALLGVIVEPLSHQQQKLFHVMTVVYYRNWTGPVYFNVIRPFHHLVVGGMAMAGVRAPGR